MATAEERPAKRARIDYSDSIEVLVGPEETSFMVYKDVITKRSPFFRAALAHDFKEAQEQRVRLPESDRETFNLYLGYIYGDLEIPFKTVESVADSKDLYHFLFELYILADQIGDLRTCNDSLDHIIKNKKWTPRPDTSQLVYDTFPRDHKLRDFAIALGVDQCTSGWLRSNRDTMPADFFAELAVKYNLRETFSNRSIDSPPCLVWERRCKWHQHDADVPEEECK